MFNTVPSVLLCALLAVFAATTTAAGSDSQVANGSLEGPFPNGLAAKWIENWYGDNEFTFTQGPTDEETAA